MKQSLDSGWMSLDEAGVQVAAILGQLALEGRRRFPQSPEAQIALGAMDILIAAYREPPSAPELADALGYSYGHVARAFRSHFGMTIRQKLTEIRVKEAVSLISMGASLKEAAAETGFNDYYYFLRVFTKTTGTSPGRAATEGGLRPPKRK
jgi:AraC-like DNA-binding protein